MSLYCQGVIIALLIRRIKELGKKKWDDPKQCYLIGQLYDMVKQYENNSG